MSEVEIDIRPAPAPNPLLDAIKGVRIVDFSQIAAGPLCSMLLADLGAIVIKVESPTGDIARGLGPPFINGESSMHLALNRNKHSVVADLKNIQDRERIMRLIAEADVVIEGFRPGVATRLGVGFDDVKAANPDVIYCSISAFGQRGEWSHKAGVDGVIQAVSGLMSITGEAGSQPSKVQAPVVDMVTGLQAAIAILAALAKRDKGEAIGHIDVNLYASAMVLQQIPLAAYLVSKELPQRMGSGAPYATPNEAYATKDGHLLIAAYQKPHWTAFCEIIERPDLIDAPAYKELPDRLRNREALSVEIEAALAKHTTAYWIEQFDKRKLTCAPIADYALVAGSDQVKDLGAFVTFQHPAAGEVSVPGFCVGGYSPPVRRAPPLLGEHNDLDRWPDET